MKTLASLLLLSFGLLLPIQAQECKSTGNEIPQTTAEKIAQSEKTIKQISNDLQQKSLQFNWTLMDKYLNYCSANNKHINITKDSRIINIKYEVKPKELEPQKKAYEEARDELKKLLNAYPEYVEFDSIYKSTRDETKRKEANAVVNAFYSRLSEKNKDYLPMRDKEQKALREYHIAVARYALEECKRKQQLTSIEIIDFRDRESILESDSELNQLSIEINLLKGLQREAIRSFQKLKYNIDQ